MRVLIVEDEALVAAEIEFLLGEAGMTPIGVVIESAAALEKIERERPDLVLLDVHLSDGPTGVEVARRAIARYGAAGLFMTANRRRLPEDFAGAIGAIAKPYTSWGVIAALKFVADCLRQGEAVKPAPSSLELAPAFAQRWRVPSPGYSVH